MDLVVNVSLVIQHQLSGEQYHYWILWPARFWAWLDGFHLHCHLCLCVDLRTRPYLDRKVVTELW